MNAPFVHPLAVVEHGATLGHGVKVWHFAHVRAGAHVGPGCVLGKNTFVDAGVRVGANCKIQNNVSVYAGVELADGVFLGPHVCFTNDRNPRAITPDGALRGAEDWQVSRTHVGYGASIGANATIVSGVRIGRWAMIGAGAVVTHDVPDHALAFGVPSRLEGVVSPSGEVLARPYAPGEYALPSGGTITTA